MNFQQQNDKLLVMLVGWIRYHYFRNWNEKTSKDNGVSFLFPLSLNLFFSIGINKINENVYLHNPAKTFEKIFKAAFRSREQDYTMDFY